MSQYNLQQFIKLWAQERLTVEQAVGQLLLHIQELSERVGKLEKRILAGAKPSEGEDNG